MKAEWVSVGKVAPGTKVDGGAKALGLTSNV